jgi:membrane-associated phospholipid phosphatase
MLLAHYLTDVLAGLGLGVGLDVLVRRAGRRQNLQPKKPRTSAWGPLHRIN